jgi:hypothetical protein
MSTVQGLGKTVTQVPLHKIQIDRTKTRASTRFQAVAEYAELISSGIDLDPAVVFDVDGELHLASGAHRRAAYQQAGRDSMPCELRTGTLWDAIEFGIRDNQRHVGERLTTADKRHNVQVVLKAKPKLSNSAIAELCAVSDKTVAKYRAELEGTSEIPKSDGRVGQDGRTIQIGQIGVQKPESAGLAAQHDGANAQMKVHAEKLPPAPPAEPSDVMFTSAFENSYHQLGRLNNVLADLVQLLSSSSQITPSEVKTFERDYRRHLDPIGQLLERALQILGVKTKWD